MARQLQERPTSANGQPEQYSRLQTAETNFQPLLSNTRLARTSAESPASPGDAPPRSEKSGGTMPIDKGGPAHGRGRLVKSEPIMRGVKSDADPRRSHQRAQGRVAIPEEPAPRDGLLLSSEGHDGTWETQVTAATTNLHFTEAQEPGRAFEGADYWCGDTEAGDCVFSRFPDDGSLLAGMGSQF